MTSPHNRRVQAVFSLFVILSVLWSTLGFSAGAQVDPGPAAVDPVPLDWGDAPDLPYPTLAASNGASHELIPGGPFMGQCVDPEPDGQPSTGAVDDDLNGTSPECGDDEDGVTFQSDLIPGFRAIVDIDIDGSGVPCLLDAWIDFDGGGGWDQENEQIAVSEPLPAGVVTRVEYEVPAGAVLGPTYARFRCSANGGLPPDGPAMDGEVEDYEVNVGETPEPEDWGDAPDGPYPTLATSNGAMHGLITGGPFMGACVDSDLDGQPSPGAVGDDGNDTQPGCVDDEDGVSFPAPLLPGDPAAKVDVDMSGSPAPCLLDAWIDFDQNGTWDPLEQIAMSEPLTPGPPAQLLFPVPFDAVPGPTYGRFRCSVGGGLQPDGWVPGGEVEDHEVVIAEGQYADWGDAPDGPYPTLMVSNGARHLPLPGGPFMGLCVDAEPDGQPAPGAGDDDGNDTLPGCSDDEDGVFFPAPVIPGDPAAQVIVDVSGSPAPCFLDAWIDFDQNGTWEPQEQIATAFPLVPGTWTQLFFAVPFGAVPGPTYARFRCSSVGGLPPDGPAPDGEVEDYEVEIQDPPDFLDWGDAPEGSSGPTYPTLAASNGAAHHLLPGGPFMGRCVDPDWDGQPTPPADGDDLNDTLPGCVDDEDGVSFLAPLVLGDPAATVNVDMTNSRAGCLLDAWIDFDASRTWDAQDQITAAQPLTAGGQNVVTFAIPPGALPGTTWARFRCSSQGGLPPDGPALDGEVEDYEVVIRDPSDVRDWGDAPDRLLWSIYPTLAANNGASHAQPPGGPFMGSCVDPESDGLPTPPGTGDDLINTLPNCVDDEDGVSFLGALVPGDPAALVSVDMTNSPAGCLLDAWIDFDRNQSWDAQDQIAAARPLIAGGPNGVLFAVPPGATPGTTYARFRCSTSGGLPPGGPAPDGEVEDYLVFVEFPPEPADWGDAPDLPQGMGYPTLSVSGGASHLLTAPGPFMGACVDPEANGQPSLGAVDDDLHDSAAGCTDDEDGVGFPVPLLAGDPSAMVMVDVSASPMTCTLNAWIDFDGSSTWDAPEQIATDLDLAPGTVHPVLFAVPAGAVLRPTYARFRCDSQGGLGPGGPAADGEVEDYEVEISAALPADWGDAPDFPQGFGFPTLGFGIGASHLVLPGSPFMGACVDTEINGQPSVDADGDDLNDTAALGCVDDEDGVTFPYPLVPGNTSAEVVIDMSASPVGCWLNAWVDFDGTGVWEPTDQIATDVWLANGGPQTVTFAVPPSASSGRLRARFRCSGQQGLPPGGPGGEGEVEDYVVPVGDHIVFWPGWNLIGLRLQPLPLAEDALDAIAAAGGNVGEIYRWLSATDLWEGHIHGLPFANFQLNSGEGNFYRASMHSHWRRSGVLPAAPVPVQLNPVWTLISIPRLPCAMQAEDVLQDIAAQGGSCSEIYRWNWVTGLWEGHVITLPFGNFGITDWEGYFVRCAVPLIYTPGAGGVCPP